MIRQYHRPTTLENALELLSRPDVLPMGGGTLLSHTRADSVEVVDLQALGLNQIALVGNKLEIGATSTLQQLLEDPNSPPALRTALKLEAPLNLRNAATLGGTIAACDGRSPAVTALLALDARLDLRPIGAAGRHAEPISSSLGDYLALRPRALITKIVLAAQTGLAFEYVSRTPSDKPIVCVAAARWSSGRTRLAVGGYGRAPLLATDGTEAAGMEAAARNAFHEAGDEWASAAYRADAAATLARRCLASL